MFHIPRLAVLAPHDQVINLVEDFMLFIIFARPNLPTMKQDLVRPINILTLKIIVSG